MPRVSSDALSALKARRASANSNTDTKDETPGADTTLQEQQQDAASTLLLPQGGKTVTAWAWTCSECQHDCVPIRSESRCLCGHRLKQHAEINQQLQDGAGSSSSNHSKCNERNCQCNSFYFIVAEGSWILRCRCKHKHIEHNPVTHNCNKPGCNCDGFWSPWVCNCNHPWSSHTQHMVQRQVKTLEQMVAEACIAEDVNRHDLIKRGLEH